MFSVTRDPNDPFIAPDIETPWRALAAFNPSPVIDGNKTHVLYRAAAVPGHYHGMDDLELSTVAAATSIDGEHFKDHRQLITPSEEFDQFGCEDPRVTLIDDTYYIFYTALSQYPPAAEGIKVAVATSRDLKTIDAKHIVTPFNAKAMTLFHERVGGKLCAILTVNSDRPPAHTAIALFDKPEDMWSSEYWEKWYNELDKHLIHLRRDNTDHVEVGAAPLRTKDGWLLIYSHIQNYFTDQKIFGIEAALLDLNDPTRRLARTNYPFMVPETGYEKYGRLPNIIFPSGSTIQDDKLTVYYGATDTTCCRASMSLKALLDSLSPDGAVKQHVKRYEKNPILEPIAAHEWESSHVLNPAAIELKGDTYILYRAVGPENTSVAGLARSHDGFTIDERLTEPIYVPRADFEQKHGGPTDNSGCEDARVVHIGDRLYITYTGYDSISAPQVAESSISVADFLAHKWDGWSEPKAVSPEGVDDKDACIIPEKIGGKYLVLHRIAGHVCADYVDDPDFRNGRMDRCIQIFGPRPGMWDSRKVGIAGPPIKTPQGYVLFYHGITDAGHYCLGAVLLDRSDPTHIIGRTSQPIMTPVESWECAGWVPNVVFPCGQVLRDGTIYLYYGGADHVVAVATIELETLVQELSPITS
ncbi:MAG TPA: hypothetical protein VHQ86_06545 [Candidatus Saccharimonadia bacterium]|jgi:predicted GH43/DUF377 family glycosyl hydrolase|nr:hypothetical protein [Candidatus Saccharimonadia bacterium]